MSNTFLLVRYVAFAFVIAFSAVICIVAALNLGTLTPNTPRAPEVDSYLIFLGALGLVVVFPIIFVELVRKNAFIARVVVEIAWVSLLWVMHLSGAAAITAIAPQMLCSSDPSARDDCPWASSTKVLLAFTWLCTLTLLSYLLTLVICAVYHHQEDSHVWRSGVRDYRWFARRESLPTTTLPFSYGKLVDPKETIGPPPTIYAAQMGLAGTYSVEPLKIESSVQRPMPPVPAATSSGQRLASKDTDTHRAGSMPASLSLYPQHMQASMGQLPALPSRVGERAAAAAAAPPPPAGSWPRSNPQEPLRKKSRSTPGAATSVASSSAPGPASNEPDMAQQTGQVITLLSASRSRPSGPRTPATPRPRPPPLDLSRVSFRNEPPRP